MADIMTRALGVLFVSGGRIRASEVSYRHASRMMPAALLGLSMAAVVTVVSYVLLVVVSFFVVMPLAAHKEVVVGGLLTVIFAGTFTIAFRKMVAEAVAAP